jgi:hypothetical protein
MKTRSRATNRCPFCSPPHPCGHAFPPAPTARRLGDRVEPRHIGEAASDPEASERAPRHGGMSLHAEVAVPARDWRRLERLCRYVARPPLASERLEEHHDGRLALRLKTRWRDAGAWRTDPSALGRQPASTGTRARDRSGDRIAHSETPMP